MNKTLAIILASFSFIQCAPDRSMAPLSESEKQILFEYQQLDSVNKTYIADEKEPGERLLLCLTFVNKAGKNPLSNQPVKFYHTSITGDYAPAVVNDESTARLNGAAITDNKGRIYVETILPGDYGSSSDNRHIHTTVEGARVEAYDIHFKQYTTAMGKLTMEDTDQFFLLDLKTTENKLAGFVTIEVKDPVDFK